ncbi:TrbC/VirB2 family protein [Nisaea sp.]|uniref:TrbC/VirB2 family protein n=1 Tax=Nisaea sp. TaxID=2024842 RepID=UPI0032647FB7
MQVRNLEGTERLAVLAVVAAATALFPDVAEATTTGLSSVPWEGPMDTVSQSIQGPVAASVGAGGLALGGLSWALGQSNIIQTAGKFVTGGSVAFNAASWGMPLLGYSGAALI